MAIYRYVTEGSFDAYMWQALETKARFIAQVMTGASTLRQAEDIGGQELSYAEVKAIASGNPAVLTLLRLTRNYSDSPSSKSTTPMSNSWHGGNSGNSRRHHPIGTPPRRSDSGYRHRYSPCQ